MRNCLCGPSHHDCPSFVWAVRFLFLGLQQQQQQRQGYVAQFTLEKASSNNENVGSHLITKLQSQATLVQLVFDRLPQG